MGVVEENAHVDRNIRDWLEIINHQLPRSLRYRNTLELARAFRLINGFKREAQSELDEDAGRNQTSVFYCYCPPTPKQQTIRNGQGAGSNRDVVVTG